MSHLLSLSCLCLAPNPKIPVQRHLASPVQSSSGSKKAWALQLLGGPNLECACASGGTPRSYSPFTGQWQGLSRPLGCGRVWTRYPLLPQGLQSHVKIESFLSSESTLAIRVPSGSHANRPVESLLFFRENRLQNPWEGVNAWPNLMVRVLTWEVRPLLPSCPCLFMHFT